MEEGASGQLQSQVRVWILKPKVQGHSQRVRREEQIPALLL